MDSFINSVKNVVSMNVLIYMVIAIVVLIVLTIILFMLRKKKACKQLEELEIQYNSRMFCSYS